MRSHEVGPSRAAAKLSAAPAHHIVGVRLVRRLRRGYRGRGLRRSSVPGLNICPAPGRDQGAGADQPGAAPGDGDDGERIGRSLGTFSEVMPAANDRGGRHAGADADQNARRRCAGRPGRAPRPSRCALIRSRCSHSRFFMRNFIVMIIGTRTRGSMIPASGMISASFSNIAKTS